MRWAGALLAALSLASAPAGAQQTGEPETVEQARQQGQAFGREKRNDGSLIPSGDPAAQELPGYQGTDLPQGDYFDDPDRLASEGGASSANHEGYRTVVDSDRTRPRFDPEEIRQTTGRRARSRRTRRIILPASSSRMARDPASRCRRARRRSAIMRRRATPAHASSRASRVAGSRWISG
ncbi:MAG: hypothetical protein DI537_55590 [Stutzerimonas stutzeri]|nr:MAG: hypothetical protein DI537_55590 [Stutzerimonas stutzeri]